MYYCKSTGETAKDYQEYLKTEHWQNRRNDFIAWHHYTCCLCRKSYDLEVHHKTYENIGDEKDEDLILVCKYHHKGIHWGKFDDTNLQSKKLARKRSKRSKKSLTEEQRKIKNKIYKKRKEKEQERIKEFDNMTRKK